MEEIKPHIRQEKKTKQEVHGAASPILKTKHHVRSLQDYYSNSSSSYVGEARGDAEQRRALYGGMYGLPHEDSSKAKVGFIERLLKAAFLAMALIIYFIIGWLLAVAVFIAFAIHKDDEE